VFYNLACSYSLLKQVEEAFAALREAVKLGYDDARWLTKDPDLDNLRHDNRFEKIRSDLSKKPNSSSGQRTSRTARSIIAFATSLLGSSASRSIFPSPPMNEGRLVSASNVLASLATNEIKPLRSSFGAHSFRDHRSPPRNQPAPGFLGSSQFREEYPASVPTPAHR